MSATGRKTQRDPSENYPTPPWCLHRLLEAVELPGGLWLEPSAGTGNLIRAAAEVRDDVIWHAVEYREECLPALDAIKSCQVAVHGSFQAVTPDPRYAVCCGNPPYGSALAFVQHAMKFAPIVVMLLRLNWLASDKRAKWMRENTPSVWVLPDRPSFTGTGGDATEYAWMVWGLGAPATVSVLATTPRRQREKQLQMAARRRTQLQLPLEVQP